MANDLRSFEAAIDKFMNETVPEKVAELQQQVAISVLNGVVNKTPVDTGRARANWQVSLEAPVMNFTDAVDKEGTVTIAAGSAVAGQVKPFSILYVQNNLPYITALEDGHSKQAPAGMVSVTLADVQAQFE